MRVHISLDEGLIRELDELVGPRQRSPFIAEAVRHAVDAERRWRKIESAFGTIADTGHEWDDDPAAWVRTQRQAGERPVSRAPSRQAG